MTAARAVLFDLDGTLADSIGDIAGALNMALMGAGIAPLPAADIKRMVGGGARVLVERALETSMSTNREVSVDQVLSIFLETYAAAPCVSTSLYPGARETLCQLRADGFVLGVVTNKPQKITEQVLAALGIADHFRCITGSAPGCALKPSGEMITNTLAQIPASRCHAIMVGDSAADTGAARAAGVVAIVISHGYSLAPVESLGSDAVINHFDELRAAIGALQGP